jgi:Zn-dependent protease
VEAGRPELAADGLAHDRDYEAAIQHLRKPKRLSQGLLLIGTLALFVLVRQSDSTRALFILVSVLLFHEAGHYVGMRVFGYRDVKMFFIPFFGAAVSGKKSSANVAAWKEGVVLLLGPVPGIVIGLGMALSSRDPSPAVREVALMLLGVNLFNLLPLAGLDGARLLQLALFSRRRWLEIAFQVCAGAATAAVALALQSVVFGVVAALVLLVLPYRWRVLKAADRIVRAGMPLPAEAVLVEGEVGRALFSEARTALGPQGQGKPASVAAAMEQVLDAALSKPPPAEASIGLGLTLFVAFVLGVVALVFLTPPVTP